MKPLKMHQFRASEVARARWDAIPRPFGVSNFSDLVRHALNQLWKTDVEALWQPGRFNRHHKGQCTTCHCEGVLDRDENCFLCWNVKNPSPEIAEVKEAPANGSPAKKPRAQKKPAAPPAKRLRTTGRKARKAVV